MGASLRQFKERAFLVLALLLMTCAGAEAQRQGLGLVFVQHNLSFENNDAKVVLHWMATPQGTSIRIKMTCRLANPANRKVLYEWEGTTPHNQPALGRVELGGTERSMVLGYRHDQSPDPQNNKDLVRCDAIAKTSGSLKYDGVVRFTEAQLNGDEEGRPSRLRLRVFKSFFGTPDKQSGGTIRCALLYGSRLQEVVEFKAAADPDGSAAIVEIPLAIGRFATGLNCVDGRM